MRMGVHGVRAMAVAGLGYMGGLGGLGAVGGTAHAQCPVLIDNLFTVLPSDRSIADIAASSTGTDDFIAAATWSTAANGGNFAIYRREGPAWVREQLTGLGGSQTRPVSVAIAGDVAVLGLPFIIDLDVGAIGEVSVYVRLFNTPMGQWEWVLRDQLYASDGGAGDQFGHSVAIAGTGEIIVGANLDNNAGGSDAGAVYVFTRSGASPATWSWTESQKLVPADPEAQQNFGKSVATGSTSNRSLILIGASGDDILIPAPVSNAGAAYMFSKGIGPGAVYSEVEKIVSSAPAANDFFGFRVGMTGSSAVIGMAGPVSGSYIGAVFATSATNFPPSNWAPVTRITAPDGASGDYFGQNLAVSGNTMLVSAEGDDHAGGTDAGAVYVYRDLGGGGGWTNIDKFVQNSRALRSPLALSGTLGVAASIFDGDGTNRVEVLNVRRAEFGDQPESRTVGFACTVEFDITVVAPAPSSHQWQFRQASGSTWVNIVNGPNFDGATHRFDAAGANTNALALSPSAAAGWTVAGTGGVRCQIVTPCGGATSDEALLSIRRVNFNCSLDGVTVQDLFEFLAAYFSGDPAADINGQGGLTVQDIFDFLGEFFGIRH